MARLLVHVEGETEETFINEIVAPHLYNFGYQSVAARIIGNARLRRRRGGIRGWNGVRDDILRHMRQDAGCLATIMVDYYGLPRFGSGAWPGRNEACSKAFAEKARTVQEAIRTDICSVLGTPHDCRRFFPYVVMHEFEALLFSNCNIFANAIGRPELEGDLQTIRNGFCSPEEINDSPTTAPSKRVTDLFPRYQKIIMGNLAALSIGLGKMRDECPNFGKWIEHLENWPNLA